MYKSMLIYVQTFFFHQAWGRTSWVSSWGSQDLTQHRTRHSLYKTCHHCRPISRAGSAGRQPAMDGSSWCMTMPTRHGWQSTDVKWRFTQREPQVCYSDMSCRSRYVMPNYNDDVYITLHHITLHPLHYITSHSITYVTYVTSHHITSHHITSHYIHYITLHTLHYIHYIT